jgi:hypothetical protein
MKSLIYCPYSESDYLILTASQKKLEFISLVFEISICIPHVSYFLSYVILKTRCNYSYIQHGTMVSRFCNPFGSQHHGNSVHNSLKTKHVNIFFFSNTLQLQTLTTPKAYNELYLSETRWGGYRPDSRHCKTTVPLLTSCPLVVCTTEPVPYSVWSLHVQITRKPKHFYLHLTLRLPLPPLSPSSILLPHAKVPSHCYTSSTALLNASQVPLHPHFKSPPLHLHANLTRTAFTAYFQRPPSSPRPCNKPVHQ